ncbi:MAG: hypothetical protein ACTSQY_00345 [Candidatus Odinarchaeia archaeon]|nr:MAG: hypothetical protein [Lokiarchaeota virus Fenrir Meg22_1012]URC17250.1 MAG: hypothetical protein [Lokiarchaeota virus Fenrir Meg22_1214]
MVKINLKDISKRTFKEDILESNLKSLWLSVLSFFIEKYRVKYVYRQPLTMYWDMRFSYRI